MLSNELGLKHTELCPYRSVLTEKFDLVRERPLTSAQLRVSVFSTDCGFRDGSEDNKLPSSHRLTVSPSRFFGLRRQYHSLVPEKNLRSTVRSRSDNPPWCTLT